MPEALVSLERALSVDPTFARCWMNRASVLIALRRNEEALQSADRALACDAQLTDALLPKAIALEQLKYTKEAIAAYSTYLDRLPPEAAAHAGPVRARLDALRNPPGAKRPWDFFRKR